MSDDDDGPPASVEPRAAAVIVDIVRVVVLNLFVACRPLRRGADPGAAG
jgi:hypothetical protein